MSGLMHVRIEAMEYRNAQGTTEIEVSAVEEPLATIVRMPVTDHPRYAEQISRLRAERRVFPVAADFFEMAEAAKCRELLRAVSALFPSTPADIELPGHERTRAGHSEETQRVSSVIHRTGGPFLVLENSEGEYGLLDDIEANKLRQFLDDDPVRDRPPIDPLLSDAIWDQEHMETAPALTLNPRENRWALELESGELFAHLDDRDITAIRHVRGW